MKQQSQAQILSTTEQRWFDYLVYLWVLKNLNLELFYRKCKKVNLSPPLSISPLLFLSLPTYFYLSPPLSISSHLFLSLPTSFCLFAPVSTMYQHLNTICDTMWNGSLLIFEADDSLESFFDVNLQNNNWWRIKIALTLFSY